MSTLTTRNNYTGPAIRTLENEEIEELISDNCGDYSYINWEKNIYNEDFMVMNISHHH